MIQAESNDRRVLLVNPPVYDTRFHWGRWQNPALLYRIASYYRMTGCDVRVIDAVALPNGARLKRELIKRHTVDGVKVDHWRYGLGPDAMEASLKRLKAARWVPGRVLVECFTTFWWQGAAESVRHIRSTFPDSRIAVVGGYATLAPDHVRSHLSVTPLPSLPVEIAQLPPDWSIAPVLPRMAYLPTNGATQSAASIVEEIELGLRHKIRLFAFGDYGLFARRPDLVGEVLDQVLAKGINPRFLALGSIAPRDVVANPSLVRLMRRAGFRQIYFEDDRAIAPTMESTEEMVDSYHQAVDICREVGFPARSDALNGGVCIGRRGEDLRERATYLTRVAHAVGAVIVWPYQPSMNECLGNDLELHNGKLFPLRDPSRASYRDYLNLLGLAAILNAKYRENTFAFLGNGYIARLFRASLTRRAWSPGPEIKGGLSLPVLPPRQGAVRA